jgi:hypothetical protein
MKHFPILMAVAIFVIFSVACLAMALETAKQSDNWLLDAEDDTERFKRIQQMFGGFSAAMQGVGDRYERTFEAVIEGNFNLADYHWKKVRDAIELGFLRRPGRKANAVALFLEDPWPTLEEALAAKDGQLSKEALLSARSACMTCHVAENVPFINDQPMFRRTVTSPEG